MPKILKATHQGSFPLVNVVLNCAVLEDGTRILSTNTVFKAFGRTPRGRTLDRNSERTMPVFIDANNLQPFIGEDLKGALIPIKYKDLSGNKTEGFKAEILPRMCEVYLKARAENVLSQNQLHLADKAGALLSAFANTGIIGVIDEATGYQEVRDRLALQEILKQFISEELLPWTKKFPDKFYKEMFRLRGWHYPITKRPSVIGRYTNDLIYEQLPPGVLEELKKKTPRSSTGNTLVRYHQSLTEDIGHPALHDQILIVMSLMEISPNWDTFIRHFSRKFKGQTNLDLNYD